MQDAGAAAAAAQVLAFFKEPVRYRPRLTHGHEPIQGARHVFRFAQGRFPHSLMRDLSVPERERLREASIFFIRQVCLWEGATHYQMLGLAPDARRDAIKEHYHGLMALLHPDRLVPGVWPTTAAQRVNQAYAVLSQDAARHTYDAELQKSLSDVAPAAEVHPEMSAVLRTAPARRRVEQRSRDRRAVLAVAASAAALLFGGMWWVSDVPSDLAVLTSAAPLDVSTRWMREALASRERPRFLTASQTRDLSVSREGRDAGASQVNVPFLTPLWQALSTNSPQAQQGRRSEPAGSLVAAEAGVTEAHGRAGSSRESEGVPLGPAQAERAGANLIAHAAQVAPVPAERALPLGAAEMEVLVAGLVQFYEAGDVERLLALHDASSAGGSGGQRLRDDFQEFFRSTRARRLRLDRLSWEASPEGSRAKGQVTVTVEYKDKAGKFERRVPIEVLAAMRDGQPRILRLLLFPHDG